jgi:hypothetical protein
MYFPGLLTLTVLAQTAAETIDPQQWWIPALQAVLTAFGGLFVWLLKTYGGKLVKMVVEKSGNPFLGEIAQRALVVVMSFYQSEVRHIKGTISWTESEKRRLCDNALAHLKMMLDADKLEAAAGEMGADTFLRHQIEAAVATAKQVGKSAKKSAEGAPVDPTGA